MKRVMGEGRFIRISCCGCYGHVLLAVEQPLDDDPFRLFWEVEETQIPREYEQPIIEGIMQELAEVRWATPLHVHVVGGRFHEVDSNARAFKIAARLAMKQALERLSSGESTNLN
jgi:elongation factor G